MESVVWCSACGLVFDPSERACPDCGSKDRSLLAYEQIKVLEGFKLAKRNLPPGEENPYEVTEDKILRNHDRGRLERRIMMIDRQGDCYVQEWYDLETGKITFSKRGRLSDPEMHGKSARRKSD